MTEFENYINKEIDNATWEDECGALESQPLPPIKTTKLVICLGLLITLPLMYLFVKRR